MAVETATRRRRFQLRAFLASVVCLVALASVVTPAGADLSTTPDPTWGVLGPNNANNVPTNPRVYAMVRVGDTIYLGGKFSQAVPPESTPGPAVPRANLVAINATTGQIDMAWDPVVQGSDPLTAVHTLALSSDGTTIFAGGNFASVDGVPRKNLVALDVLTGEVDLTWKVEPNFPVWTAVTTGTKLFLGGNFTNLTVTNPTTNSMTTTWRKRLAAVDQNMGTVDKNWKPSAEARVKTLELSPDRTWLYVGGDFKPGTDPATGQPTPSIAGGLRYYVAALETATGNLVQSFEAKKRDPGSDPTTTADDGPYTGFWDFDPCGSGCVIDIAATPTAVYLAIGGKYGNKVMAVDAATGGFKFERYGDGDVQALALRGNDLYVGGHFEAFGGRKKCSDPALVDPTKCRDRFVVLNATTNAIKDYYVYVDSAMGIWSILAEASRLYLAGDFKRVATGPRDASRLQPGFAQFTDVVVVPTPSPTPTETVTPSPTPTETVTPSPTPTETTTATPSP